MSIETARNIGSFLNNNNILSINLMGGEFFCHPEWVPIFDAIITGGGLAYVRLVTNGDWAKDKAKETMDALMPYRSIMKVSISEDPWHTNENSKKAAAACKRRDFTWNTPTEEERSESTIVPVGRGEYHYNLFGMFSCYCRSPDHMYSFMIDEKGDIFKCPMGVWDYANVEDYVEGGFPVRFKEFNKKFNSVFISNCRSCIRAYESSKLEK